MKLTAAVCPCCGAGIEVPEDRSRCFCSYCGSQILTEAALAFAKVRIEGTVQIKAADFVVEAGKLREYHGESVNPSIPENVHVIGARAFAGKAIQTVRIPCSVVEIEQKAFEGCCRLEGVNLPDSISVIGDAAFSSCRSLKTLKLPNAIKRIGPWTFAECSSLDNVSIPDSVETISGSSFKFCTSLSRVKLPASLRQMGPEAFAGCDSLREVEGFDERWGLPFEGTPFLADRRKGWKFGGFRRSK